MRLDDVSTASTVYIPIPLQVRLLKVVNTVLEGSLTTGNATVTVKNAAGMLHGTLTITQSGSAAGDIDTLFSCS